MRHTTDDRYEIELPTGAVFPDWSVVTAPAAEEALLTILGAFGAKERHRDVSLESDVVRRAVLDVLPQEGLRSRERVRRAQHAPAAGQQGHALGRHRARRGLRTLPQLRGRVPGRRL